MNKTDKNNGTHVKVVDITGKLCDFITLKEFMKRTALIDTGIISQAEIDSNEWLTIDEAERETIESIRQIYKSDDNIEQLRIDEMKGLSAEEQTQFFCPNDVIKLEEFREIGHDMIDELYHEMEIEEQCYE